MKKMLNKRNTFKGIVVGEAMAITKNVYERDDYYDDDKPKIKKRPKTFKNANLTISGGVKWITEDYIIYENRDRIPLVDVYYNDKLILEKQPIYFGNSDLRKNFKIGDEIHFDAVIEEFDEFECEKKSKYYKLVHYVDKYNFEYLFDRDETLGIFERENGDFNDMKYVFTKTVLSKGTNIWKR